MPDEQQPPLIEPEALGRFLDDQGIGEGELSAERIGEGHSNVTFLIERGGERVVLRRPPRPPLPPSAHDVLREARVLAAVEPTDVRVPKVLATCDDESVLGVPLYLMEEMRGTVITDSVPAALDDPEQRERVGRQLIEALVEIHAADWQALGLEGFGKPSGYLERQLRLWTKLWDINATRELAACHALGERLLAVMPESAETTVVHGDYRLGNVMVAADPPARVAAILDWEMATLGDPLADLGYFIVSWSAPGATDHPLLLSSATAQPGFATREELAARYAERTGRDVSRLDWYQAFALWKASVFCEAIYGRYLRHERDDSWAAALCDGVPRLLEVAKSYL
jgi:aminoglycoside phosphotransferase (APT) family kinase protein